MRCPKCDTDNPEQARFCLGCGTKLTLVCPKCKVELPSQAKFCFACGVPLGAPPPDPLAEALKRLAPKEYAERLLAARGQVGHERRTVTILFSDIKGSTSMAESLDPEDVLEVMNGAFEFLIPPIFRYEGTLAQLMGDAILAFFGAPIAHEDDPERACRAALDIIVGAREYAAKLERERGIRDFNVRVGINTGPVVVGEVGTDLRVAYTAMGDTINVAARMEQAAEPGTILISEETHRRIAPLFDTLPVGPLQMKGKAEPVPAFRALGVRPAAVKARGIAGLQSPMVGRDVEFQAMQEAVDRLAVGVGGIVTIIGEAGLGKSRLVAEVRHSLLHPHPTSSSQEEGTRRGAQPSAASSERQAIRWVEGRCLSYGTSIAYLLWLDALRSTLGMSADDLPIAIRGALWQSVQMACPEQPEQIYPYLARLMNLPLEAEHEALLGDLQGEALKVRTFRAVETLVECVAKQQPLVLVCEDLQWADPTSLQLLEHLLALTDRVPLLIVTLFRPERERGCWGIKETAARLYSHRHTDLWLAPLSEDESKTLLGNLMGLETLTRSFREHVLRHAEGNPFYVEEILRSLISTGAVRRDEAQGGWVFTQSVDEMAVPETLQGVLVARIDRLREGTKRVLQVASVIGRIFEYRILADIAHEEVSLDDDLIILQREGMIRERARLPELEYIFKHELTREAAYNGLLRKERRALHRQVAEALERLYPDRLEEHVEILAQHWDRAEEPAKATKYLVRAGDRARRLGASLEAIDFYRLGLERAEALPPSERPAELLRLHESLGDVYLLNLSRHAEALAHYTSFLQAAASDEDAARAGRKVAVLHQLCGRLVEAEQCYRTALARLGSVPRCAEASAIHCGLAYLLWARNQLAEAETHAREGLDIAGQVDDARALADANRAMATVAYARGDFETACSHLECCFELYRDLGDLPRTAQTCNNLGETYRILGQMSRALERLDEGLELARRIGDTRDEAHLLGTKADLFMDQGRWAEAIEFLTRTLPLAEESGVAPGIIEVHLFLGSAYEGAGQSEEALRHLEIADRLSQETQYSRFAPRVYLGMACVKGAQGEFDEARRLIGLAHDAAGPEPPDLFLGLMHRCFGHVQACCGNWDDAVTHLQESLEFLQRENLPAEVGRTCLSLGRAYASRDQEGDRGRAREHLLAAQCIFRQIEAQGYLLQVEEGLEKIGTRP